MVPVGAGGGAAGGYGSGGHGAGGNVAGSSVGGQKDASGLNANRQRGFSEPLTRIETPRLSDMKAKQGAVVARFLTFAQAVLFLLCL